MKKLLLGSIVSLAIFSGFIPHIDAGTVISLSKGNSLRKAAATGNINKVNKLVNSASTSDKNHALINAVQYYQTKVVQILLENGANVNYTDPFGNTPLYCAAGQGYTDIVQILLDHGANMTYMNPRYWGYSPLIVAAERGKTEVVRILLENGADKNFRNYNGEDAWKLAANLECKQLLQNFQHPINQVNSAVIRAS